ncbi:hypothetical protein [Haloferula sp. A504]|uniref:hypothetical protein n=1 Tax=Haloferula sp. A504 TaxID=3373601 RepID=UPI0031BF4A09|nr:hypothetical protein [Verrucomicrobiaceae bacterium E54]
MTLASSALVFPATATVIGWVIFGGVSMIALGYAKLKQEWFAAVVGVSIGVYPYFFPSGPVFWTLGVLLTTLLFVPRRHLPW